MTAGRVGARRLHRRVPAEPARRRRTGALVGQDLRQRVDQLRAGVTGSTGELRPEGVEPALQEAPQVGGVALLLACLLAQLARLLERQGLQTLEIVLGEHPVDPPVSSL